MKTWYYHEISQANLRKKYYEPTWNFLLFCFPGTGYMTWSYKDLKQKHLTGTLPVFLIFFAFSLVVDSCFLLWSSNCAIALVLSYLSLLSCSCNVGFLLPFCARQCKLVDKLGISLRPRKKNFRPLKFFYYPKKVNFY